MVFKQQSVHSSQSTLLEKNKSMILVANDVI